MNQEGKKAVRNALAAAVLCACATTSQADDNPFRVPGGNPYRVLDRNAVRTIEGVQDAIRHYARTDIERAVRESTGGRYSVGSTDRPAEGGLGSRAHDRGAIDIRTPNTGTSAQLSEARDISRRLGPGYNVVVEQTYRRSQGHVGADFDRHTTYSGGYQGRSRVTSPRATGTHTHVQPNYGVDVPWRAGTFGATGSASTSRGIRDTSIRGTSRSAK